MAKQRRTAELVKKTHLYQESEARRNAGRTDLSEINPSIIERPGGPILNDETNVDNTSATKNVRDSSWINSMFLVKAVDLEEVDANNRFWSTADSKYTDTSIGGNIGINARPQFTRYADIRKPGRLTTRNDVSVNSTTGDYGMGHYYSEAIDDNAQTVYMEFGVPKFSGMSRFLSLALDPQSSYLARTGRTSKAYTAGKAIGAYVSVRAFPVFGTIYWISNLGKKLLPVFSSSSKYYYLKPAMHMYWSTVNSLVSNLAVNMGIMHASLTKDSAQPLGKPMKVYDSAMEHLRTLLPDIFTSANYIDVYAIANRAQRIYNQQAKVDYEKYSSDGVDNFTDETYKGYLKTAYVEKVAPLPSEKHSFSNWIVKILSSNKEEYVSETDDSKTTQKMEEIENNIEVDENAPDVYERYKLSRSWMNKLGDYFTASATDGASFAIFKVNYTGTVSESFSTSVKEPAIQSALNGFSRTARDVKFNLSGGELVSGLLGDTIDAVVNTAEEFIKGKIDGLTFGFTNILTALLGGGFIDVPKQWEDTTVTLPKINYTMDLVSPYGNTISQLQNIYIPLAMIMAGALPLGTGKQSYTSPFLCSIYDRGRQYVKLGIIDSLSISRGTTNLAFNATGRPLGMEVSFSVLDLSSIMSMPVSDGSLINIDLGIDEDHLLSTYLNVITGRDLYSQRYILPKAKIEWAKTRNKISTALSPANWGMWSGEELVSIIKLVAPGASTIVRTDY
jgi:hypothetical protein